VTIIPWNTSLELSLYSQFSDRSKAFSDSFVPNAHGGIMGNGGGLSSSGMRLILTPI